MRDPRTNIYLEGFITLFSLLGLIFSIIYTVQLHHAPFFEYTIDNGPQITWSRSGSGTLYFIPPAFTLILSITNILLYGYVYMPPFYGILMSSTMVLAWIAVFILWLHCHINIFDFSDDDGFCYQRNLYSGYGNDTYEGVNERLMVAAMAFAVLIIIIYALYVILTLGQFVEAMRIRKAHRRADEMGHGEGTTTPFELRRQGERDGTL
ncbi:hypothetical protein BDV96DRAFT_642488 [Lophiotrema nucula]|uniref:Uncharacterized protein n=1 Tax=Lophiotrema nucula TaxID=690887 RepID=A0A6A5ZKC4_9PLEO|nr:hypothetical protein BDV96DRAFT_642488 [Lophiotrema nucula]